MRVFFNLLAIWSLGISLLFGIFDIARSVAQSRFTMMPLLQGWQDYLPDYLSGFADFVRHHFWAGFWDRWLVPVLNMPAWALFLILSIMFYMLAILAGNNNR